MKERFIVLFYLMQLCMIMFISGVAVTISSFIDKELIPTLPYVIIITFLIAWVLFHRKIKQNAIELYYEIFKEDNNESK